MFGWGSVLIQKERYADLLREAERERLARQVLASRERRNRVTGQAPTWLGHRPATWGCRLQEQHAVAAAAVHRSACGPCPVK
jgi:hypothetical protein